jgi:hypothetical protein
VAVHLLAAYIFEKLRETAAKLRINEAEVPVSKNAIAEKLTLLKESARDSAGKLRNEVDVPADKNAIADEEVARLKDSVGDSASDGEKKK